MIPFLIVNRVKKVKLLFYFVQAVASSYKQLYEWVNSVTLVQDSERVVCYY